LNGTRLQPCLHGLNVHERVDFAVHHGLAAATAGAAADLSTKICLKPVALVGLIEAELR
jgi:hypothetical protein